MRVVVKWWQCSLLFSYGGRIWLAGIRGSPSTGLASEGIFEPLAWQRDQENDQRSLTTQQRTQRTKNGHTSWKAKHSDVWPMFHQCHQNMPSDDTLLLWFTSAIPLDGRRLVPVQTLLIYLSIYGCMIASTKDHIMFLIGAHAVFAFFYISAMHCFIKVRWGNQYIIKHELHQLTIKPILHLRLLQMIISWWGDFLTIM